MQIQHHRKYKEIHGVDEIVMMDVDEHTRLHKRLREEGKCTVPADVLHRIASAAHKRTPKGSAAQKKNHANNRQYIEFYEGVGASISLVERVVFNRNNGAVYYMSRFIGGYGQKILFFDIPTR